MLSSNFLEKTILSSTIVLLLNGCGADNLPQNTTPQNTNTTITDNEKSPTSDALKRINNIRESVGLNKLQENLYLDTAAKNHAKYLEFNHIAGHYEDSKLRGFTGVTPSDRTTYAGYKSLFVSENLSVGQKTENLSVDGLMSAIYHRLGFLDMDINEIGFSDENNNTYVYDMGNSFLNILCDGKSYNGNSRYVYSVCADQNFKIESSVFTNEDNRVKSKNPLYVLYPYSEQKNVDLAFYEETPDPLPNYSVSGYPISVIFNDNKIDIDNVSIDSFTITDSRKMEVPLIALSDGNTIMSVVNDQNHHFSPYEFAIFPENRLDFNSTYYVSFDYEYNGESKSINWKFKTKSLDNLIVFSNKDLNIQLNHPFKLYFPPVDPNDVISTYQVECSYNQNGSVEENLSLYDENTLNINILGKDVNYCDVIINGFDRLRLNIK